MREARIELIKPNGRTQDYSHVMRFTLEREAYTPYVKFSAEFSDYFNETIADCYEVKFFENGRLRYSGMPDRLRKIKHGIDREHCCIESRSFTALLAENQLQPGLYMNQSLNSFMNNYISLPKIAHENSSAVNYVYVKKGASMWDGITTLAYKLTDRYPYIRDSNTVMMHLPDAPKRYDCAELELLEESAELLTSRTVSHFHIEDLDGTYGQYDYTDNDLVHRSLTRHRYCELDRRFLSEPEKAGAYRSLLASRGMKRRYFKFNGYVPADINDILILPDGTERYIKRVRTTSESTAAVTEISVYDDKQPS